MIKDSNIQTELDGIRELSHTEVEAVTGAGFFGSLWKAIKAIVHELFGDIAPVGNLPPYNPNNTPYPPRT